jgi:uracil-DNA glycosylase
MTDVRIEASWKEALQDEFALPYWETLTTFVRDEYQKTRIYPPPKLVFNAFEHCPFSKVKVVILGQDPYHNTGQAHGLSFSVPDGVRMPPSLQNIYKEIRDDTGTDVPERGNLEHWADQGVLLLNATLTVRAHQAGSHQGKGWEQFTDAVVRELNDKREHLVFMLWGNYAKAKGEHIDRSKHLVLEAPHPSPYSANSGFFGCKHFSQANAYIEKYKMTPIDW